MTNTEKSAHDRTSMTLIWKLKNTDDEIVHTRFDNLYRPMLLRWAALNGAQEHDADDLAQNILSEIKEKFRKFEYDRTKSFRGWLRTITKQKWIDHLRRRENRLAQPFSGELEAVPESERLFEETEYRKQLLARALEQIAGEFQEKTWQAFQLHALQGLAAADTAKKIGSTEGAVRTAKSRVMSRLRAELGEMLD